LQSVSGIDVSSSALQRDTRSRSTSFNFATTKNIPTLFAKFSLDGNYGFGSGEQAVNGEIIKTKNCSYGIHSNVALTPISWLELKYDIDYGWSQSRYTENKNDVTSLIVVPFISSPSLSSTFPWTIIMCVGKSLPTNIKTCGSSTPRRSIN
jgi:hypothetical protein